MVVDAEFGISLVTCLRRLMVCFIMAVSTHKIITSLEKGKLDFRIISVVLYL